MHSANALSGLIFQPLHSDIKVESMKEVLQSYWNWGVWKDKGGKNLYSDLHIILNESLSF